MVEILRRSVLWFFLILKFANKPSHFSLLQYFASLKDIPSFSCFIFSIPDMFQFHTYHFFQSENFLSLPLPYPLPLASFLGNISLYRILFHISYFTVCSWNCTRGLSFTVTFKLPPVTPSLFSLSFSCRNFTLGFRQWPEVCVHIQRRAYHWTGISWSWSWTVN